MVKIEDLETQGLEFHGANEALEYKDSEVFNTIILHDSIESAKNKLKNIQLQGIDTHGVFSSFFIYFSIEKTPGYP